MGMVRLELNKSAIKNGKTCSDCFHLLQTFDYGSRTAYSCELMPMLLNGKPCQFFNKKIKDRICFTCGNFLGNAGDWGLCCSVNYYSLNTALDEACEDYVEK